MDDIKRDWSIIKETASQVLKLAQNDAHPNRAVPLAEVKKKSPNFGTSLLLSNSPMTPKVINASFMAIFDHQDIVQEFAKRFGNIGLISKDDPALRKRIKGLMLTNKQYSLDSRMDLMNSFIATVDSPSCSPKSPRPEVGKCYIRKKRMSSSSDECTQTNSIKEENDENVSEDGKKDKQAGGHDRMANKHKIGLGRLCSSNSQ